MGTYIAQADVENVYGTVNVARWSQLDPDTTTADTTRIAASIAYAEEKVQGMFRGTKYAVPFAASVSGGLVTVQDWCARLAGAWLYRHRKVGDATDGPENEEVSVRREVEAYTSGMRDLGCVKVARAATAPHWA